MYKVIVKAWVKKDDKFLLAQRASTEAHHAGVWSLPGGNVESEVEENVIENTIRKELEEEIGVEVEDRIELIYSNSFIKDSDGSQVLNLTVLAHCKSGEAGPLEDTAKIKWCTLEELRDLEDLENFLAKEIDALIKFLNIK